MKSKIRLIHRIVLVSVLFVLLLCLTACQESTSSKYERANKLLTEGKYTEAATIFDEISTYEDASKMSLYTKAINAAETGDYETAFSTFTSLGEFKDCPMMITYYKGRQNEASVYDGTWIYWNKWFDAIEIYESIPLFRDSKERAENCRKAAYDQAIKRGDEGDTAIAISILKELGTYSDAAKQVTYYQAVALLNQGDYSGASTTFSTIPGFRDADSRVTAALEDGYKAAAAKEESGELDEANAIFLNLGEYKDSYERANKPYYDLGLSKREAGKWDEAVIAFERVLGYKDASVQISITRYMEGEKKLEENDWDGAVIAFQKAGEYNDAETQIYATYYSKGLAMREAEKWDEAITALSLALTYSDAEEQINETRYQKAKALYDAGEFVNAYEVYREIAGYKDVEDLLKFDEKLVEAAVIAAKAERVKQYRLIGNTVTFGKYEQDNDPSNGQEDIEWIVLDVQNERSLLLSKYDLDVCMYYSTMSDVTWEESLLRQWLNSTFLDQAFNKEEKNAIIQTKVDNSVAQGKYDTYGNDTQDYVFVLSYSEAKAEYKIEEHKPTAYALARYLETPYASDNQICSWLRSPAEYLSGALCVDTEGKDYYSLVNIDCVVRPMMWIDTGADVI